MKLVCFPGYTCGALLCDILNKESSQIGKHNNLVSANHNRGKIALQNSFNGTGFDNNLFETQISNCSQYPILQDAWIGTHCWAGELNLSLFDQVVQITTENRMSKIYRFTRIFYTMLSGKYPDMPKPVRPFGVDQFNQGYAKAYAPNIINIEFEDIVEWKNGIEDVLVSYIGESFRNHIHNRRKVWIEINDFLYDKRLDYIINNYEKVFT